MNNDMFTYCRILSIFKGVMQLLSLWKKVNELQTTNLWTELNDMILMSKFSDFHLHEPPKKGDLGPLFGESKGFYNSRYVIVA